MENKHFIQVGNKRFPYQVIRTRRTKRLSIEVAPCRGILVRAPRGVTQSQVKVFLSESSKWIGERIAWFHEKGLMHPFPGFVSGDRFLFLGEWHSLQVIDGFSKAGPVFKKGKSIHVLIPDGRVLTDKTSYVRDALAGWYRQQASKIVPERVTFYVSQMGIPAPPVRIGNARRRWGSCSARGRLNFTWRIVMAPIQVID
ncbi:MAG: M48 family metallopeptidase, partial [Candidatus Hydrogenedentota bacterium]